MEDSAPRMEKHQAQVQMGRGGAGEQPCREGPGGAGRQQAQHESALGPAARRANPIPGSIKHSTTSCSKEGTVPLDSALVQPHCEYFVWLWAPQFKKVVKVLECVQRRTTKLVQGLEGMSYEEQLRTLGLSGLEKSRQRGDLLSLCSLLRS